MGGDRHYGNIAVITGEKIITIQESPFPPYSLIFHKICSNITQINNKILGMIGSEIIKFLFSGPMHLRKDGVEI